MEYYGDVYRPPSEARSLIIQVSLGCSNNTCAFCTMYKAKRFVIRPLEDILNDLYEMSRIVPSVRRVFLADGDALSSDTDFLLEIINTVYKLFPSCERVTSYATPQTLLAKTEDELKSINKAGLQMLYMGLESGNDEVLKYMLKGVSAKQIVEAGVKARSCGFKLSVTAINGLGGTALMREHAVDTGKALSLMNPEYIGLLTLIVHPGTPLHRWVEDGSFTLPGAYEMLEETRITLENLSCEGSVFRMNHASNYLALRGTLSRDKERMLSEIDAALDHKTMLKPEYFRAL